MDYSKLIMQLRESGIFFDVIVNIDGVYREEFGLDLSSIIPKNDKQDLIEYIKKKYPNLNLRFGKVTLGGAILGIFSIISFGGKQGIASIYNAKPGDTLQKISEVFNTTPDELIVTNELKVNELEIDQAIIIPAMTAGIDKNAIIHTVSEGETLNEIAQINNISRSELISYNALEVTDIKIGQTILLPNSIAQDNLNTS